MDRRLSSVSDLVDFAVDLERLLARYPQSDKRQLFHLMTELGWRDFDIPSLNGNLYQLEVAGRARRTEHVPPLWSAIAGDDVPEAAAIKTVDRQGQSWSTLVPLLAESHPGMLEMLTAPSLPDDWRSRTTAELTDAEIESACQSLGGLLLELGTCTPLGQLVPTVDGARPVTGLALLRTRARNALMRNGCLQVADLLRRSPQDLMNWNNIGHGTVVEIIAALLLCAVSPPAVQTTFGEEAVCTGGRPNEQLSQHVDPRHLQLVEDVVAVARWHHLSRPPGSPLLASRTVLWAPPAVLEAQARLDALTADDVLSEEMVVPPHVELELALADLDARELDVLRYRTFATPPETLDEVGQRLGVTRERVRQIESALRARLASLLTEGSSAGDLASLVHARLHPVSALARVLEAHPLLAEAVPSLSQPLWAVLDRLDDRFDLREGWAARPTLEAAVSQTLELVSSVANDHGAADLEAVAAAMPHLLRDDVPAWVERCGLKRLEGHVLLRGQSILDRATALLSLSGAPLSVEEIASRAAPDRAVGSVRNALALDDRFTRVDRERYALAEWGHDAYDGIREAIGRELDANGGEVVFATLLDKLVTAYGAAPTSVTAYASALPYELRGGLVRRRESVAATRKSPQRTARLYRHADTWMYRLVLTNDHIRGSGFTVPIGLAQAGGCEQGSSRSMTSPLGPQVLRWTAPQPAVGSIRRFIEHMGVQDGEIVFLEIGDGENFSVVPASPAAEARGPVEAALRLVGHRAPWPAEPLTAIAATIGLSASATWADVLESLRTRNDKDVAGLLECAWDELPGHGPEQVAPTRPDEDALLKLLGYD